MKPRSTIDLNADVGEGFASDADLMPLISSANIACGGHAGNAASMQDTVALALAGGVAIGAHPGFDDREHFGRRELPISPADAGKLVIDQTQRLVSEASKLGGRVSHVKLHGALYNMAARDPDLAEGVAAALAAEGRRRGTSWVLFALAGSLLVAAGRRHGLTVVGEGFADRLYRADGSLTPRSEPGAVIADTARAAEQAARIAAEGSVIAGNGAVVSIDAGTLCLHGDGPHAVEFARSVRDALGKRGVRVGRAPSS